MDAAGSVATADVATVPTAAGTPADTQRLPDAKSGERGGETKGADASDVADVEGEIELVVREPEPLVADLFVCVKDAAGRIFEPAVKNRLLLGVAVLEANYDLRRALATVEQCQLSGAEVEDLSRSVLAIASRDLTSAVKLVERQVDGEFKNRYLKAIAHKIVELSPEEAARIAARLEPRIARELLLLELVDLSASTSPEGAEKVSEKILEPAWNDLAYSLIARHLAATDPQKALALLDKIEGELVKRWAVLHIAFQVAKTDPLAAVALDRLLPTAYFKDELYVEVVSNLAGEDSDKALAIALRISDANAKKQAVSTVARAMFARNRALALHVLEQNLGLVGYEAELRKLLVQSCRQAPDAFLKHVQDPASTVRPEFVLDVLRSCCDERPAEVRHVMQVLDLTPDGVLSGCFVCAGLEKPPREAALAIEDAGQRNKALVCHAVELSATDLPAALEVVKLVDDGLSRSEAKGAIVGRLARAGKGQQALLVVASITDPYLKAQATLVLASSGGTESATTLVGQVEMQLPLVQDSWRRDDLLVTLAGLAGPSDLSKAVQLASSISSPELQEEVLESLARSWFAKDPQKAVAQKELFLDLSARGQWCLHLANLAATPAGDSP